MKLTNTDITNKDWLDYSTLSYLLTCPRKYYWRCVREVAPSDAATYFINGHAYHECKKVYYESLKEGMTHEGAVGRGLLALGPIMKEITTEDKKRNLTVAVGTMSNYFDYWKDDPYQTVEVEVKFAVDLKNFILCGRIDRLTKHPAFGKLVEETKTTTIVGDRWPLRIRPNLQIDIYYTAIYILTGELYNGGVLDIIPIHENMDKKPMRYVAPRNIQDVEDCLNNVQEWWLTLQTYKERNFYPQNTEACAPLVGMTCDYQLACSLFPHPQKMSELELPSQYKVEKWAPFPELLKEEEVSK